MLRYDQVRDEILAEIDQLFREARIAYTELVLPGWGSPDRHGFPRTLYGYVMTSFSFVDLLSRYQSPQDKNQTSRMRRFMTGYLGVSDLGARLAVQLWRHTLMHTGVPRTITDSTSGQRARWLLHWEEHLPRDQHMLVIPSGQPDEVILNVGAFYLIADLRAGADRFFSTHALNAADRVQVENAHAAMVAAQIA